MEALTYLEGEWQAGNPPILGPLSHAMWMASLVFDGARAFEGTAPDLDRHCARIVRSAQAMGLAPMLTPGEIEELARDGITRFPKGEALYIRPMFWAEDGFVAADPTSTRFALTIVERPMPGGEGFSTCLSRFRRPTPETAPTEAKAACLYPNSGRALSEARAKGFDNAVMLDPIGNVAELATANLFLVKDGVAATPAPNGTFLNGITRQRVIALLRRAGIAVEERQVRPEELAAADELFSTGNYGKVQPIIRHEDREFGIGPVAAKARELYWAFAHNAL